MHFRSTSCLLTVALCALLSGIGPANAAELRLPGSAESGPTPGGPPLYAQLGPPAGGAVENSKDTSPAELTDPLAQEDELKSPAARRDRYWYLIAGVANVWPRLEESTAEIDRDINNLFGPLLPRWEEPDTFADWRDKFMLWDVHLGAGYSFNDHWSAFSTAGFIAGTARTENVYFPIGLPTNIKVKFHRKVWFVSAGLDYYPWGKPDPIEESPGQTWLTRRLFAARPFVEAGGGYVNIYTIGQVKVAIPLLGDLAKVKHAEYYDLFYLSPRVGVDIPITDDTHLSTMAGYLFFMQHPDEFSTWSFYFLIKHRF